MFPLYNTRRAGGAVRSYLPPLSRRFTSAQPRPEHNIGNRMLISYQAGVELPFLLRLFRNEFRFSRSSQILLYPLLNWDRKSSVLCFTGRQRSARLNWRLRLSFFRFTLFLLVLQFTTTLHDVIGEFGTQQANSPKSIVLGRNRGINLRRIAVRISKSDDGDFQAASL